MTAAATAARNALHAHRDYMADLNATPAAKLKKQGGKRQLQAAAEAKHQQLQNAFLQAAARR